MHVRLATEGALLGRLIEQGVSPELVILSDGAAPFDLLVHASCWVHAERPLARAVPYSEVAYYRDYLTGAGYLAASVAFKEVGTSLKVRATLMPGNQVKVRVTPVLSWSADDRPGVIEVAEASTELIVPNRRPVVMGGSATTLRGTSRGRTAPITMA